MESATFLPPPYVGLSGICFPTGSGYEQTSTLVSQRGHEKGVHL